MHSYIFFSLFYSINKQVTLTKLLCTMLIKVYPELSFQQCRNFLIPWNKLRSKGNCPWKKGDLIFSSSLPSWNFIVLHDSKHFLVNIGSCHGKKDTAETSSVWWEHLLTKPILCINSVIMCVSINFYLLHLFPPFL